MAECHAKSFGVALFSATTYCDWVYASQKSGTPSNVRARVMARPARTSRSAMRLSAGHGRANQRRGSALSSDRAVHRLADAVWSQWTDSEIARHCQVSQSFVTRLRRSASYVGDKMRPRKVKRGDKVYEMRFKENSSQT